jgi:hypothetical protein
MDNAQNCDSYINILYHRHKHTSYICILSREVQIYLHCFLKNKPNNCMQI